MTICIYLHNMCIVNFNGFDMNRALKVEKEIQVETFGNMKGVHFHGWVKGWNHIKLFFF
jgi:hypothetical protein